MTRTISATEARSHFGETMRRVAEEQETVIVERVGKPRVVMLPIEHFHGLQGIAPSTGDWWERAMRSRERIAAELNGRAFPDMAELIREGRNERDAQIFESML